MPRVPKSRALKSKHPQYRGISAGLRKPHHSPPIQAESDDSMRPIPQSPMTARSTHTTAAPGAGGLRVMHPAHRSCESPTLMYETRLPKMCRVRCSPIRPKLPKGHDTSRISSPQTVPRLPSTEVWSQEHAPNAPSFPHPKHEGPTHAGGTKTGRRDESSPHIAPTLGSPSRSSTGA